MRDASPTPAPSAGPHPQAAHPRPLFILANPRSGSGDKKALLAAATGALDAAGHPYEVVELETTSVENDCLRAAQRAAAEGGAVVAAGGDGTASTVANAARVAGVPFGLLPMGTFNYFA